MRGFFLKAVFLSIFSFLNCGYLIAQIVDFDRENPYKKVFVETDNFGPSYLKTLENAYALVKTDSIQFSILNDLAYYWHTRNLVKALKFTNEGLALTAEKKDSVWEGRFQITQGAIFLRMERLGEAQEVLESAKSKVRKSDLASLYTQLGYVYERRGELDKAADYALEALHLGKKLNDKKTVALAFSDLSNLFWKQSKFRTGLEYGLKSLAVFEDRGITDLDYDFTLYVVGNNYLALKEYRKALQYYEHSLIIAERYGFYNNLSDVYISLVDLYSYLQEFDKGAKAGNQAVRYALLLDNEFMLMRSWLAIGKLQLLRGKNLAAIESLRKSIGIATDDFGDEYYLSQAYESLGRAYAANNDYREAYMAFAEYDVLKNRIFTAEADQRISLLRTEFDVANKENTILLQEAQIQKQRTWQVMIGIIAGLLFLLLLLASKAIQNKYRVNRILQKRNAEKEFLLKEIHHRVKNNLEMVSSLLSLQSAQIRDPNVSNAISESQHRVHSMGMIHQKLYQGENLAAIEMKDYFVNLSDYIVDSFGAEGHVTIEIDMKKIELDVDMAIPIGLIVNELLTNSLKYAFPNRRQGLIQVSLKKIGPLLELEVIDNGLGRTPQTDVQGTGFGTQLISLLTKQLDGKMVLNMHQGTSVSIQFQHHKAA
ncbi:histidine kinase [Flavobacteriaceae bacterium TP-CH-4]|uniref:histidine kinase n=1 Tax=Pelagihabitans pacificus TaxID=2696054 RepID=A0A967EDL6_9FLAO|nr:histidine kinase dimerization/phosphoacceptor domain -containing protein [Pelagihabitans pacificus]NHF59463.1 histidine kinase [Pelagihabitans pacificus]